MRPFVLAAVCAAIALPALAQDRPIWFLNAGDGLATLGYAIPDSEDAGPMLTCDRTTRDAATAGKISVTIFVDEPIRGRTTSLEIKAGTVIGNFPAKVMPDEMNGGSQIDALVPVSAAVIAEFARTGRIKFTAGGQVVNPPVAPVAKIAGLMKVCRT